MQNSEMDMWELYELVDKLNIEADKAITYINTIKKKGANAVCKAESVLTQSVQPMVKEQTKKSMFQLIERLVEINCDLELADDVSPNLAIPYIPVDCSIELKFLSGDNPWNFWLFDGNVNTKILHKNLLKKYQNDLLDPYPNPKPSESVCFLDVGNKVSRGIVLQVINENRVKLVDCDSNVSKIIASEKLFKADPDACHEHASALRCTITKDSVGTQLWNSDLRDVFCAALKEAVLNVRILERLTGSFPIFVVDVEMRSEYEDSIGNLKDWIIGRLLPELKKLSADENESICSFLSTEALNPYSNCLIEANHDIVEVKDEKSVPVTSVTAQLPSVKAQSSSSTQNEIINNLNTHTSKMSVKTVPNVDLSEGCKSLTPEANDSETISSSSEEVLVSSSNTAMEIISKPSHESQADRSSDKSVIVLDNKSNSSRVFRPIEPVLPDTRQRKPFPVPAGPQGFYAPYNYPPQSYPYPQFSNPYPAMPPRHMVPPPWAYQGAPIHQMHSGWNRPPIFQPPHQQWQPHPPPTPVSTPSIQQTVASPRPWSSGEESQSSSDKDSSDDSFKIANINNINVSVNVMAPEFVPKKSNDQEEFKENNRFITDEQNVEICDTQTTPIKDDVIHFELRKPRSLLTPGENLLVLIAYVESPSEFYVHFFTHNNKFMDKLHGEMFSYYAIREKVIYSSWRQANKALGKFCACKWPEDNHWYRAEVLDWALGDNNVKVYFVDCGNTACVPLSCIQPLTADFCKMPMCAQLCHLAKVFPSKKGQVWSKESIDFFKSKVEVSNNRVYSVTVVPSVNRLAKMNSLSVLLYEGKATDDSLSINDLMVDYGMAWCRHLPRLSQSSTTDSDLYLSLDEIPQLREEKQQCETPEMSLGKLASKSTEEIETHKITDWDTWDPMAADFNSVRNNPAIDTDDPGVALIGYAAKDEARICKFYAKSGFCWKGDSCTKEHSMPKPDRVTTDREEVFCRAFSEIILPSVGEVIEVKVTAVSNISLFYVQLDKRKGCAFDEDDDDPENLEVLSNFINSDENKLKMRHLKVPPALGQLVLAKWNDLYYRARVVSADDVNPEVMFVDFGSICSISSKDLREMEPQYLHLPFQAIECSLANIIPPPVGSAQYEEGSELLRSAIEAEILTAKVYDSLSAESIKRMELLLEDAEEDIGDYLVRKGCATKINLSWDFSVEQPSKEIYFPG